MFGTFGTLPLTFEDPMPFGAHRNVLIGFIYLFDPGYLNWALAETDSFCLADIERIRQLKVFPVFDTNSSVLYGYIGRKEIFEDFLTKVSLHEIKFNGTDEYSFSNKALSNNENKLRERGIKAYGGSFTIPPSSSIVHFINYKHPAIKEIEDANVLIKYIGFYQTSKGCNYQRFTFDNSSGIISKLPNASETHVGLIQLGDKEMVPLGDTGGSYKLTIESKTSSYRIQLVEDEKNV